MSSYIFLRPPSYSKGYSKYLSWKRINEQVFTAALFFFFNKKKMDIEKNLSKAEHISLVANRIVIMKHTKVQKADT